MLLIKKNYFIVNGDLKCEFGHVNERIWSTNLDRPLYMIPEIKLADRANVRILDELSSLEMLFLVRTKFVLN